MWELKCHSHFLPSPLSSFSHLLSFSLLPPSRPSRLQRRQGYQNVSSCFLPDPFFFFFYLRFPRINSPVAHPTQPINFFPPCPMPALVVFEGKKKKKKKSQLESLVTSIERASSPATHPPAPSPPYLGSASSFWLGHLTTAITLYDFI